MVINSRLKSLVCSPAWSGLGLLLVLGGCAKKDISSSVPTPAASSGASCYTGKIEKISTLSTGEAQVFLPDPGARAGSYGLAPSSRRLDEYRSRVALSHLGGQGVLEGQYVDIRNGLGCSEGYGAFERNQSYLYSQRDARFQEAMTYYWGDSFRAELDQAGYLQPTSAVKIIAHCMNDDNAYYERYRDASGNLVRRVCIGNSVSTPGASYSDDAAVVLHELQHATTSETYSTQVGLNQFWYDEAGALNEGISDFMSLMFLAPTMPNGLDPRTFSRWALGTFIPGYSGVRGVHKCPEYDATFPQCTGYPGFSSANNTISYVYPDGVGWPYANNYEAPAYVKSAFENYRGQEQIHNAGVLISGALWDVYESLKANRPTDEALARKLATQVVHEAIAHLPKPTASHRSPVTFRAFAEQVVLSGRLLSFSTADQTGLEAALTARGLYGGTPLPATWASPWPGQPFTPGVRILDNPVLLKSWLDRMGVPNSETVITQGVDTGYDGRLSPGEVAVVWFDLANVTAQSAGGILLKVQSGDPDIEFLDRRVNVWSPSPSTAQMFYSKVYGTATIAALNAGDPTRILDVGNSYFGTNPFYDRNWTTALWIKVSATAARGKSVTLTVDALPSNGAESRVLFPVTIY